MVQITWTTTHGDTNTRTTHPNDVPTIVDDLQQSGIITHIEITKENK